MKFLQLLFFIFCSHLVLAQERVSSIWAAPYPGSKVTTHQSAAKTTALLLPFFEDFTDDVTYVNPLRWIPTAQVYVNNNMGVNMRSRGVVTFDAINSAGLPYDTLTPGSVRMGDTLLSQPIDLSNEATADSIYLSFLLQPQGYGFAPETQDSFLVYFKNSSQQWIKVTQIAGSGLKDFFTVMVPVNQPQWLHPNFQFRFINKISINSNDDVWNVDYVKLDKGRTWADTLITDVAFTATPSSLLGDLTSMPYRHYLSNAVTARAAQVYTYVYNNNDQAATINSSWNVTALPSNQVIHSNNIGTQNIPSKTIMTVSDNSYSSTVNLPGYYDQVIFNQKFWLSTSAPNSHTANDTIVHQQIFDNYLAYDDGSAEKSYYLNLFPTLPGRIAIEFSLPNPDTLKGVAIYFGRQSPLANKKLFGLQVYQSIAYQGAQEVKLYEEFDFTPVYDSVNKFWNYQLSSDVPLPAGTFYIGTMQPAFSGADSLYIGLDVQRVGGNHAYYNVLNNWEASLVSGALMIRPLLGKAQFPSAIKEHHLASSLTLYPNPSTHTIYIPHEPKGANYEVKQANGQVLFTGVYNEKGIIISHLTPGIYYLSWTDKDKRYNRSFYKK